MATARIDRVRATLHALRQLVADPDDTPRVFEITRALGLPSLRRGALRFKSTPVGRRVLAEQIDLLDTLRDRAALAKLPAGTLGRAYHDFVYREEGAPLSAPEPVELPGVPEGAWSRTVTPDPVMLFRYSALTFNGHRIHYDQPYVTQVEHYPGLIVHGPLIATLLLEVVRLNQDRPVAARRGHPSSTWRRSVSSRHRAGATMSTSRPKDRMARSACRPPRRWDKRYFS